jgi:hypothetical protein
MSLAIAYPNAIPMTASDNTISFMSTRNIRIPQPYISVVFRVDLDRIRVFFNEPFGFYVVVDYFCGKYSAKHQKHHQQTP